MKTTFIYGLFDPRNYSLRYIGKSDNPDLRLKQHIKESKCSKKHERYVCNWIRQLLSEGLEPSIEILEEVPIDSWEETESAWIAECRKFRLDITNLTDGGDCPPSRKGKKLSEGHKDILRQSAIGRLRTEEERRKLSQSKKGKSTWVKGKHLTDEHKQNIGLANSGKKLSKEAIAKRLAKTRGRPLSESHKQNIGEGLKAAYSEGRRESRKGTTHSRETRQKISLANKGHIVSEETRKKIGNSNRARALRKADE